MFFQTYSAHKLSTRTSIPGIDPKSRAERTHQILTVAMRPYQIHIRIKIVSVYDYLLFVFFHFLPSHTPVLFAPPQAVGA